MERVAPRHWLVPALHLPHTRRATREVIGACLLLGVALVVTVSLRQYAQGPDWGLRLGQAADGGVVAVDVRGHGVAWEQRIRPGDRVLAIDGQQAQPFVGQQIGRVAQVTFASADGSVRTVSAPQLSEGLKLWLTGVALLFALLGVVVYRWTVEASLARIFLVFSGATGLALASMAGALHGYAPTNFLAASSATVASAAFTAVFLWFPRPVPGARWITLALAAATTGLVVALVTIYGRGEGTPVPLEDGLFAWMGGNLLAGTVLLTWRSISPVHRHVLAPLALGIGVGIFPLAFLDALPQAVGRPPIMWADSASTTVAVIPLAFAYTILRHRLFALDAYVRRFVFRASAALALVAMFVPIWLVLRAIDMDDQLAMLVSVLIVGLAASTVSGRIYAVLESWFYPSLGLARTGVSSDEIASATSIARAFVIRAREFVPARWLAILLHEQALAREDPAWICPASDGEVPSQLPGPDQLVSLATLTHDVPDMMVLRAEHSPNLSAAVCVGPRLDGSPPGGVDLETLQLLAARVVPLIEAALLRERTEAQTRFREGLWMLARDLAAIGPEVEVLRITAQRAAGLLQADRVTVLRRQTSDGQAYAPVGDMPELGSLDELSSVVKLDLAARNRAGYVSYMRVADKYSMLVCWLGAAEPAEALMVLVRQHPFTDEDARRAVEIAEQAAGALRRSHLAEQART